MSRSDRLVEQMKAVYAGEHAEVGVVRKASSGVDADSYSALPNLRDARILVPSSHPQMLRRASSLYQPSRARGKALKVLMLAHPGLATRVGETLVVRDTRGAPLDPLLLRLLAEGLAPVACEDFDWPPVFGFTGRRLVFMVSLSRGRSVFGKVASNPGGRASLEREAHVLRALTDQPLAVQVPHYLGWAESSGLAVELTEGRGEHVAWRRRAPRELSVAELAGLFGASEREHLQYSLWQDIEQNPLTLCNMKREWAERARYAAALRERFSVLGLVHGDIAACNLMGTPSGCPVLLDWERASGDGPPYFDYWSQYVQNRLLRGLVPSAAELRSLVLSCESVPELVEYSGRVGCSPAEAGPALLVYLCHSALAVQRCGDESDADASDLNALAWIDGRGRLFDAIQEVVRT